MSLEAYILPSFNGQWLPLLGFAMLLSCIGFVFTLCWLSLIHIFKPGYFTSNLSNRLRALYAQ